MTITNVPCADCTSKRSCLDCATDAAKNKTHNNYQNQMHSSVTNNTDYVLKLTQQFAYLMSQQKVTI